MSLLRPAAILLLLAGVAVAGGAAKPSFTAKIEGPDKLPLGKLAIFEATLVEESVKVNWSGAGGAWAGTKTTTVTKDAVAAPADPATAYTWQMANPPTDYVLETFISNNCRRVYFATGKTGTYTFILAVAKVVDNKPQISITRHVVVVGVGAPPVDPPIDPPIDPPVDPPVDPPTDRYGFTQLAKDWVQQKIPDQKKNAARMATAYRTVAIEIAKGKFKKPREILLHQKAESQKVLGADYDKWRPWLEALVKRLTALSGEGKLITVADHGVAWNEIVAGLEAAK